MKLTHVNARAAPLMRAASACLVVSSTRTGPTSRSSDRTSTSSPAAAVGDPISSFSDDSAAVVSALTAFHRALETGDSARALALLDNEVLILESGGVETRAEYRAHHLPSDIAFARAVRSVRGPVTVRIVGDAAWAASSSTAQGEYRGRAVNSAGAELVVLVRRSDGWRINAIHWSSRQRR